MQAFSEISRRQRGLALDHLIERALGHHLPPVLASSGPQVDDVIGSFDDRTVVLYHQDRVPLARQILEQIDQALRVSGVEADSGLVEHVEGIGQAGTERRG